MASLLKLLEFNVLPRASTISKNIALNEWNIESLTVSKSIYDRRLFQRLRVFNGRQKHFAFNPRQLLGRSTRA